MSGDPTTPARCARALLWAALAMTAAARAGGAGEPAGERFAAAVADYEAGRFEAAYRGFRQLLLEGHEDHPVLLNLGDAAYRLGRFPESAFAFEWALRVAPGDRRARENLELARARLSADAVRGGMAGVRRWLLELRRRLPVRAWALACLVPWTLGWALLAAGPRWRSRTRGGLPLVLAGALLAVPLGLHLAERWAPPEGVLLAPRVGLKSGPGEGYQELFELRAGTVVREVERRSGWSRVELPRGAEGWLPSRAVAVFGRPETLPP